MIGLGTNRLSASRLAGLGEVWQLRVGQVVEDERSPYSAAATAALKAAFPTQWPTIRDYGWQHPALVPFINEDPMLVCSLIPELGKIRLLINSGAGYIETNYKTKANFGIDIEFVLQTLNNGENVIGGSSANGSSAGYEMYPWSSRLLVMAGNGDYYVNNVQTNKLYRFVHITTAFELYADGTLVKSGTLNKSTASANTFWFFRLHRNSPYGTSTNKLKSCKFYDNGTEVMNFVPFKRTGGTCGVLDLVGLTFYPDASGNNAFTISETPAS